MSKLDYLVTEIEKLKPEEVAKLDELIVNKLAGQAELMRRQYDLESMLDYTDQAEQLDKEFGQMRGFSSGYSKVDRLTKGFVGGELTVIAGKTSYGKTMLAINIANNIAKTKTPVLFVTLEMTKAEITSRYMHINNGISDDYFDVGAMTVFQKTDELSWKSIDGLVGRFVKDFSKGLIVIDHLHYFTREVDKLSEDLGRITKEFKKNAIRHDVPIILISHVRKTNGANANMEDLRGSSYISQDADIVLMVGRRQDDNNHMLVNIEKNRNRGFDRHNHEVELYLKGIQLFDKESDGVFDR